MREYHANRTKLEDLAVFESGIGTGWMGSCLVEGSRVLCLLSCLLFGLLVCLFVCLLACLLASRVFLAAQHGRILLTFELRSGMSCHARLVKRMYSLSDFRVRCV